MDLIILSGIVSAFALVVFLPMARFDSRLTLGAGLLFAAYLGLDDLATILPRLSPLLDPFPGRWNWAGKNYSILLALGVIVALGIRRQHVGLTAPGKNVRSSLVAVLLLGLASCLLGFIFQPSAPNLDTLAFQALMPSLAEELAYRGVAPALLLGLYREKETPEGIPWAVVLLTALTFGVWHGLGYGAGSLSFDAMSALFPALGGVAYGWLRFHSGSMVVTACDADHLGRSAASGRLAQEVRAGIPFESIHHSSSLPPDGSL